MALFYKKAEATNEKLINEFLDKSEGLQRILEKETEYFRDMKTKLAQVLIETKIALIDDIEGIKAKLVANPMMLKNLPETEKRKIRVANESLIKAAEDNYGETLKAKEVNKLILEAISEAVSQHTKVDGAYGDKGSHYKSDGNVNPVAVSQSA